jgi:hypothetical protein
MYCVNVKNQHWKLIDTNCKVTCKSYDFREMTLMWIMSNYKREVTCRDKTSAVSKLCCKITHDVYHVALYIVARSDMNVTSWRFSFVLSSDVGRDTDCA